jgi:cytochrome c2
LTEKNRFQPLRDFYSLSLLSVVLLALVAVSFHKQTNPEWRKYQKEFNDYLKKTVSSKSSSAVEISVKQIWLPALGRVDRCITCHLGYDMPGLTEAPEPFKSHPDMGPHEASKMGCTLCHGGQGYAVNKKEAHGDIKHWEDPLLGASLAEKYGLEEPQILIQIKCNVCHRRDRETPGMEMINLAKQLLTQKKRCDACHVIDGKGGKSGPDLTFVGDKPAERFDFSQIKNRPGGSGKPLSVLSWHYEHFLDPAAVVPDTKMPRVEYSEKEAWALSMLMMSWRNISLPMMLVPTRTVDTEVPAAEETAAAGEPEIEWGKRLFASKGCADCHTIGQGVEAGPDLRGLMDRREAGWVSRMILDPERMEKTDALAKEMYDQFDELGMPTVEITEAEVEAIIKYIASIK